MTLTMRMLLLLACSILMTGCSAIITTAGDGWTMAYARGDAVVSTCPPNAIKKDVAQGEDEPVTTTSVEAATGLDEPCATLRGGTASKSFVDLLALPFQILGALGKAFATP